MSQKLKELVPKPIRSARHSLKSLFNDKVYSFWFSKTSLLRHAFDVKFRKKDPMIPPDSLIFVGTSDFTQTGFEFLRLFSEIGGLQPDDRVLDVGCGIGRMAIPLTRFISDKGSYEGFDIVPAGIEWCQDKITPRHPNFRFQLADIFNKTYYPQGRYQASDYVFPFPDDEFDFVFLTSVFTHLLPTDMENYLSEISRVLKKGGTCFITYFLLNNDSREKIAAGVSELDFAFEADGCFIVNKEFPEGAVAYDERIIEELFDKYDLKIVGPIHPGAWCGRTDSLTYQDVIVARRGLPRM